MIYCDNGVRKEKKYAGDIIREIDDGNAEIKIDRDSSTFDLRYNGATFISNDWNLGRLDWLLPQIKNATEKIMNMEPVFVRSSVIEGSEIPYIYFEPDEQVVKISMVIFGNNEIEQIFPYGPFSENKIQLYDYFENNRQLLYNNIDEVVEYNADYTETFKELKVPLPELIENLKTIIMEIEKLVL